MRKILSILFILMMLVSCGKEEKTENAEKNIEVSTENTPKKEITSKKEPEEKIKGQGTVEVVSDINKEEEKDVEDYFLSRSRLSYLVEDREPMEEQQEFNLNDRAYLFTEFMNVGDEVKTIKHKWYHIDNDGNKKLTAEVSLDIRGKRWRTWSSKKLYLKGSWQVEVEDEKGNIILEKSLQVI
jgi:hypothetical protein